MELYSRTSDISIAVADFSCDVVICASKLTVNSGQLHQWCLCGANLPSVRAHPIGNIPLFNYLYAKRYLISIFLTELLNFGDITSQMQNLGNGLLQKNSFGWVSVSNSHLTSWDLAASFSSCSCLF